MLDAAGEPAAVSARLKGDDIAGDEALIGASLTQPSCFIAGSRDPVRNMVGGDIYADPGAPCPA